MDLLTPIKNKVLSARTVWEMQQNLVDERKEVLEEGRRRAKNLEDAQMIIQSVAQKTQQELEFQISEIVTLALSAVFDDPYEFKVEFMLRRGRTEADLFFMKGGERYSPLDDNGGGMVDVASFALRVALWNLSRPKTRNVLVLDEPFKWLSKKHRVRVGEMLKLISEKLGIQIIFVTHFFELTESADRVFEVIKDKNNVSVVSEKG